MMTPGRILRIVAPLFLLLTPHVLDAQDLSGLRHAKPLSISGGLGLRSSFYGVSGIAGRQAPFSYGINANATFSLYGISMPFSFTWYNHDKRGSFRQPFNQFGISPSYKWLKVHLGYRNLSFSEFTLNGYTFLGAGVEANPGKVRLGAVYGRFNQNSTYNLSMTDSLPKLTRTGWAAKVGYGTEKRFVDLSVLRIGDNAKQYVPGSAGSGIPTPEQNLAIGLTAQFAITEKLHFAFDGSYSVYTKDRMLPGSDSTISSLRRLPGFLITENATTGRYKAFKTSLGYSFTPGIVTRLEYRRIDPGFRSMGSYFFNNDVEYVTLNQSLRMLKGKLSVRGSFGLQRDNLSGQKLHTSKRVVGSFSANYNIDQNWGIDATFNNYSNSQHAYRQTESDTLRVFQVNRTIGLMPRYVKVTERVSHMVMLNLNLTSLDDRNKHTSDLTDTDTFMAMLMYNLGLLPFRANVSASVNYIEMKNKSFGMRMLGGNVNVSKTLFKEKLSLNLGNNVMFNATDSNSSVVCNMALSMSYRIHPKHSVSLNLNMISNKFKNPLNPSCHETRGDVSYAFTF